MGTWNLAHWPNLEGHWFPFNLDCCLPQQKVTVVAVESGYSSRSAISHQDDSFAAFMRRSETQGSPQNLVSPNGKEFMTETNSWKSRHSLNGRTFNPSNLRYEQVAENRFGIISMKHHD